MSNLNTIDSGFSVVITCYNLGEYLNECVESVLNSKIDVEVELIIVNDGSTDQLTLDVLRVLEQKGIFVLNQSNQGLGKARNNGIELANYPWIIPLDADNRLRPEIFIESARILQTDSAVDVVYGDVNFIGARTGRRDVGKFDFRRILQRNYIDACACFRKSSWADAGGYDEMMPVMGVEDWDLWLRLACLGKQFKYVEAVFFDYRVRENSMIVGTIANIDLIKDYMFNKPTLCHLKDLRDESIKYRLEKSEPTTNEIIGYLYNKLSRRAGRLLGISKNTKNTP